MSFKDQFNYQYFSLDLKAEDMAVHHRGSVSAYHPAAPGSNLGTLNSLIIELLSVVLQCSESKMLIDSGRESNPKPLNSERT